MRPLILISTLTALAAVGACAPATPPDPSSARAEPLRRCFQVDRVQNFRATADQTLYLRTSRRDVFEARALVVLRGRGALLTLETLSLSVPSPWHAPSRGRARSRRRAGGPWARRRRAC